MPENPDSDYTSSFRTARSRFSYNDDERSMESDPDTVATSDPSTVESLIAQCLHHEPTRGLFKRSTSLGIFTGSTNLLQDPQSSACDRETDDLDVSYEGDWPYFRQDHRGSWFETPAYQSWTFDQVWIYYESGQHIDQRLLLPGVRPFLQPPEWLPFEASARSVFPGAEPFLTAGSVGGKIPRLQYDAKWHRVLITPHSSPYKDIRQMSEHPDFLPTRKLLEYQALEISGWRVWRHDRNFLPCRKSGCTVNTRDHDIRTQICLGCGPCSSTRYCSMEHMITDIKPHYRECGHIDSLLPFTDHDTRPARFSRRFPFISDISEVTSFEKHRQRHYYIMNKGQYTIFSPKQMPFIVLWPSARLKSIYGPRVERLMNAAFFDQTQDNVVGCLFYHVRMALRMSGMWNDAVAATVKIQFMREFSWSTDSAYPEDLCECFWLGDEADERLCMAACAHAYLAAGGLRRGPGLKALLQLLESRNFLLRVWQRQHPVVKSWKERLAGKGFPMARHRDLSKQRPQLGKGWDGIGAVHMFGCWQDT